MKVTVTVATVATEFPAGTPAPGSLFVDLVATTESVTYSNTIENGPFVFTGVPAGEYVVRARRADVNGLPMGATVEKAITVPDLVAQPVTAQMPSGITVAVEAD